MAEMQTCQDCGNLVPEFSSPNQHKDGCFHGPKVAPKPAVGDVDLDALERAVEFSRTADDSELASAWSYDDTGLVTEEVEVAWDVIAALVAELRRLRGQTPTPYERVASDVLTEIKRAVAKFPTWPTDPLHAVAVVGEECGELTKAVLQSVYEPHKATPEDVRDEAVQTAAMAIRFLVSLDAGAYRGAVSEQHAQDGCCAHEPKCGTSGTIAIRTDAKDDKEA